MARVDYNVNMIIKTLIEKYIGIVVELITEVGATVAAGVTIDYAGETVTSEKLAV